MIEAKESGYHFGRISGFSAAPGGTFATLMVDGVPFPCDYRATVESLDGCYGEVLSPEKKVNVERLIGLPIAVKMDDMGFLLETFADPREMNLETFGMFEGAEVAQQIALMLEEYERDLVLEGTDDATR